MSKIITLDGLRDYLTNLKRLFVTKTDAESTYETKADAANIYETKADAATHLSKSDAAGTYLSKTDAASAYVQTTAVDQTIAGTKTFSKPIAGSVTGSSGSCTGNAATATTATTAKSCTGNAATATKLAAKRIINGTGFDGTANITTANWGTARNISITDGTNTSTAVSVNGSANVSLNLPATIKANLTGNCSGSSGSCTGNAASANIATKATQDAAGNTITTTYATKAENNIKANNSEVVHKSGDETIAGTKTFSNGVLLTTVNALMAQNGEYTLVLRNDSRDTYLLMSDKGGVPGTWSDARPLIINNSTGVCDINGNAATATTATTATNATYTNWLRTSSHSDHLFHTEWDGVYFWTYVTAGDGGYRAVRVARSDSAATAQACTGNAATATKATQDSDGNKITTTYSKNGHTHDDRYYTEAEVNNLLAGKANSSHTHPYIPTSASCNKNWYWSGQGGQPSWLWGGEDGTNMYVYNPSNFSVNYANSAGYAVTAANGVDSQGENWIRFRNGIQICWAEISCGTSGSSRWTYGASFSSKPVVTVCDNGSDTRAVYLTRAGDIGTTSCIIVMVTKDSEGYRYAPGEAQCIAIGRWK